MSRAAALVLLCQLLVAQALDEWAEYMEHDGGWQWTNYSPVQEEDSCTVERRDASITYREFMEYYAYKKPVILQGITDNTNFRSMCSKDQLLRTFGDRLVRLSTANTYSYEKVDVPFHEYVDHLLGPQDLQSLGSGKLCATCEFLKGLRLENCAHDNKTDTLYFFGDNNFTEWASLFQQYVPPPFKLPGTVGAYSFGIAGPGTGVPFHWHGPGYSEVIYGRKRWLLYPPDKTPEFHPNSTTLSWMMGVYPRLPAEERPIECTIRPGEVLYFPDRWWHATLNLDTSVFISTFLG